MFLQNELDRKVPRNPIGMGSYRTVRIFRTIQHTLTGKSIIVESSLVRHLQQPFRTVTGVENNQNFLAYFLHYSEQSELKTIIDHP